MSASGSKRTRKRKSVYDEEDSDATPPPKRVRASVSCAHGGCDFRGDTEEDLWCHYKRSHRDADHRFLCMYQPCPYGAKRRIVLMTHHMMHTGDKPFECPQCSYTVGRPHAPTPRPRRRPQSSQKGNLRTHMLKHSDDRLFPCTEPGCRYAAKHKCHLIRHMAKKH